MAAGLPPGDFWAVTPFEVGLILRAAADRLAVDLTQRQQIVYAQAVLNSFAWHKPDKMPDFDAFFSTGRQKAAKRQTPEQMMQVLQDWTARTTAAGLKEIH